MAQISVPNTGSGLGLGSNEVAVVYGQPSTYTYNSYLFQQSKVGVVAGKCAAAQSTGDGSQPPHASAPGRVPVYKRR